jgi:SnoaL-like domain
MNSKELETRIQKLEDIEAIRKLQYAYGYYIQHWQEEELVGLFAKDASIDMGKGGLYKGEKGVRLFFNFSNHYATTLKKAPPEYLHQLMPLSGIIDVEVEGKTAKGRWYGFGVYAIPNAGEVKALFGTGIWENEFVKEDGTWKFQKLSYCLTFSSPYEDGWIKTPIWQGRPVAKKRPAPSPSSVSASYPSGYILPYHYKNPVTGK